jgi:hypothetical protein
MFRAWPELSVDCSQLQGPRWYAQAFRYQVLRLRIYEQRSFAAHPIRRRLVRRPALPTSAGQHLARRCPACRRLRLAVPGPASQTTGRPGLGCDSGFGYGPAGRCFSSSNAHQEACRPTPGFELTLACPQAASQVRAAAAYGDSACSLSMLISGSLMPGACAGVWRQPPGERLARYTMPCLGDEPGGLILATRPSVKPGYC